MQFTPLYQRGISEDKFKCTFQRSMDEPLETAHHHRQASLEAQPSRLNVACGHHKERKSVAQASSKKQSGIRASNPLDAQWSTRYLTSAGNPAIHGCCSRQICRRWLVHLQLGSAKPRTSWTLATLGDMQWAKSTGDEGHKLPALLKTIRSSYSNQTVAQSD